MKFATLLTSAALAASALGAPSSKHVLHERRETNLKAWVKRRPVHQSALLPMRIGLTQSNLDRGAELLMDVSHHESPNYGKHYTAEEINDIFAPAISTVDAVREWLHSAGMSPGRISQSANKQWLQFDAKAREAEALFHTKYYIYEHSANGKNNIACDEYHVPAHIQEHIDYVTPGIKLSAVSGKPGRSAGRDSPKDLRKRTSGVGRHMGNSHIQPSPPIKAPLPMPFDELVSLASDATGSICNAAITPQCIRLLYNFTVSNTAFPGNELGIFEDLGDYYDQTDLDDFFASLAPRIPQGTHPTLDGIDGAVAPTTNLTGAGAESDLDFQISYPIIYPQNSVLYQTDDPVYEANYTFDGFLNNFFDAIDGSYCSYSAFGETGNSPLDPPYPDPNPGGYQGQLQCGVYTPTNVISISYGGQEPDLPISYQRRQCNEIMKLGMQGTSVLVSSGDAGVGVREGSCLGDNGQIFDPDFPATCPYITAVGATFLPPGADVRRDEETAVTRFGSGGGFSNIYPIPDYQSAAVNSYLTDFLPPYPSYASVDNSSFGADGGIFNRAGRAYPDVSAIGDNVLIFNAGTPTLIGGTSASSPTFAALLTRVNEERLAAGKSTVGFVNPTLYANPQVLHDITVGNNPGCGTDGFSCAPGWDPVTGLGTPDYPELLALFLGLP